MVQYISLPHPGISGTILRPLERLNVSYIPAVSPKYELVWIAGYYCRNKALLRPRWSGFMQDAIRCTSSSNN